MQTGRHDINNLKDLNENITTETDQILEVIEKFYSQFYQKSHSTDEVKRIPKVMNQESEEIPRITRDEIKLAMREMKNNRALGNDEIIIEAVKAGSTVLLRALEHLLINVLVRGTYHQNGMED